MYNSDDKLLLHRIAKYYYNDGMSQNEIAQLERLSRSQISRLLDKARSCGIVKIEVCFPDDPDAEELAQALQQALGIKRAMVFTSGAHSQKSDRESRAIRDVAGAVAAQLPQLLENCHTVGLGWGRSVYQTSLQLSHTDRPDMLFVPLVGNSGTSSPYLQTTAIVDRYSEKFFARSFYLSASCVQPGVENLVPFQSESIRMLSNYWEHLDAAIIGLGKMIDSPADVYIDEISPSMLSAFDPHVYCGEILGQCFDRQGNTMWSSIGNSLLAIPLHQLKRIKNVLCIAVGEEKLRTIYWAGRNGFYSTLATDSHTAQLLLDQISKSIF